MVAAIPRGRVATYGQIADLAGMPRHARLVGRTLSNLPKGSRLPWHRVVRSDGRIAFPEGSAGWTEQHARLRAEGVALVRGRAVVRNEPASMDAALWGP